tara:strand:- start:56 stop:313 length:258 start_codon:yes stop_codon:yes gene_type:complete
MEPASNKSAFKLKSGNKPSPMELSGVSPVKHVDAMTGEQMTITKDQPATAYNPNADRDAEAAQARNVREGKALYGPGASSIFDRL